jgi:hypothetical protein
VINNSLASIQWSSLKKKKSLTIKDTFNILHLLQGSNTHKVRTMFALKIIISIFVKLFMVLIFHLRQLFIVRIFVKRAAGLPCSKCKILNVSFIVSDFFFF